MNELLFRNPSIKRCSPEGRSFVFFSYSSQNEAQSWALQISQVQSWINWVSDWTGRSHQTIFLFTKSHSLYLHINFCTAASCQGPDDAMSIAQMLTDEWPQQKWPGRNLLRKEHDDQELSSAFVWPSSYFPWRTGARHAQPRVRPRRRTPWAGRQEVAVVSRGSSSLQHFTDFTERGRGCHKGRPQSHRGLRSLPKLPEISLPRSQWRINRNSARMPGRQVTYPSIH